MLSTEEKNNNSTSDEDSGVLIDEHIVIKDADNDETILEVRA